VIEIQFKILDERAIEPRNAYGNDAGYDLFALNDTMVPEGGGVDVRTGIAVAIPDGYYGRIVARSSTMRKRGLMVLEGIIDAGFRGELFSYAYMPVGVLPVEGRPVMKNVEVHATNPGGALPPPPEEYDIQLVNSRLIKAGESVAQLIIQKCEQVYWSRRVELDPSARGEKGFGSSGN
jgi:dUTP pyrophosphatase